MQDPNLEDQKIMNGRKMEDLKMQAQTTSGGKCRTKNAEAETCASTFGGRLRYVIISRLRLHNVRGYSAAELCVTMNCAEMYNMNCERNVTYTRLKLHVQLLIVPKV